jgi:hypothetical protein
MVFPFNVTVKLLTELSLEPVPKSTLTQFYPYGGKGYYSVTMYSTEEVRH